MKIVEKEDGPDSPSVGPEGGVLVWKRTSGNQNDPGWLSYRLVPSGSGDTKFLCSDLRLFRCPEEPILEAETSGMEVFLVRGFTPSLWDAVVSGRISVSYYGGVG